ncbi:hypothetical protein CsSME_00044354 [Camellia sinensis var. sinensis]
MATETVNSAGKTNPTSTSVMVSTPVVTPMVTSLPTTVPVNHNEKPEKFNETEFKKWQQKMLFYLTTLNLARFVKENAPALNEDETDRQAIAAVEAWKHFDFLCQNYILNGLDNTLYNKYKTEDAGIKKYVIGRFLEYMMVDSKTAISQVQELYLSESFQVAAIIEKLPPSWKEFKNYLKHKRKEMKLEDLIVRLRIEEDNREAKKKKTPGFVFKAKANILEHGQKKKKRQRPKQNSKQTAGQSFKIGSIKFKGKFFVCNKIGHRAKDCWNRKDKQGPSKKMKYEQAHITELETLSDGVTEMNLSAVVSEVNLMGSNSKEWWVDTGQHDMCVQIRKCLLPINKLRMESSFSWETPLLQKLKDKGRLCSK